MNIPHNYKNTTIGIIPKEWEVKEFGEFIEKEKGKYNPTINESLKCIELEHLEQETGKILGYTTSNLQKSTKNTFFEGQVLFGKLRPYLRKFWLAEFNGVCSSEVWVLKPRNEKCLNNFLYYLVQSNNFIQIANVSSGSKMPRADWDFVSSFPIALPPLPEQRRIATLLSTWDKGIETLSALLTQLQNRKKFLAQQLLSGKKRIKGFEGKWEKHSFSELLNIVKRPVEWNENELYNLISVRRRSGGIFLREALFGHQIMVKDLREVKENDFLFSKMQIVHGASALVTKEFENTKISGSYISVTSKNEDVLNMDYLNWYSKTPYFYHQTYISSYGVHIEKMTFDFNSFLELSIKLPSYTEQTAIANILDSVEREIELVSQQLAQLKAQKKGLMQVLLTGKKRLLVD